MDRIRLVGGNELRGEIPISGAKNAALTLLPCALLTDEPLTLRNLPRLADVDSFGHLLNELGVSTKVQGARPGQGLRVEPVALRRGQREAGSRAGSDAVALHVVACEFLRRDLAERGDARLGRTVVALPRVGDRGAVVADVTAQVAVAVALRRVGDVSPIGEQAPRRARPGL